MTLLFQVCLKRSLISKGLRQYSMKYLLGRHVSETFPDF